MPSLIPLVEAGDCAVSTTVLSFEAKRLNSVKTNPKMEVTCTIRLYWVMLTKLGIMAILGGANKTGYNGYTG